MNSTSNDNQSIKIVNSIRDESGAITDYTPFLKDGMNRKVLNLIERKNLDNFISKNMDILAGAVSDKDIIERDPNIKFEYFVPKLPTVPVTVADMRYTFVVTRPTPSAKGVVGDFFSSIERKDESSPWKYGHISLRNGYNIPTLTKYDKNSFDILELKFTEKFFLSDLESKKHALDFYPSEDYKTFSESGDNAANYAFYKFTTIRNSVPLTVVFGVLEDQYNAEETYPRNWFYVYMKRND